MDRTRTDRIHTVPAIRALTANRMAIAFRKVATIHLADTARLRVAIARRADTTRHKVAIVPRADTTLRKADIAIHAADLAGTAAADRAATTAAPRAVPTVRRAAAVAAAADTTEAAGIRAVAATAAIAKQGLAARLGDSRPRAIGAVAHKDAEAVILSGVEGSFFELAAREQPRNESRAVAFNVQEGLMSNLRVVIWLTWLMACRLLADLVPTARERRTTGGV